MRMWMINPTLLCSKHLLGEHGEIHKHRHNFEKKHKITKRISPVVQIEPESMEKRHNALAEEMLARKFNHKSPYTQPDLSYLKNEERFAKANLGVSVMDLKSRCPECANRITSKHI